MTRPNVTIIKANGGLGRRNASTDAVFAMVISAPLPKGDGIIAKYATVYPMVSTNDALAIGITAAYDTANTVLVYHHIYRFFSRNPSATLYVMLAPQTAALADMVDPAGDYAPVLLKSQQGLIKMIGIARNPANGYEPVLAGGYDQDVLTAINNAQALYENESAQFRYAGFLIEGRSFNGAAAASTNFRTLACPNVSITPLADPAISNIDPSLNGYAAVGDVLGIISLASVSQDPGELTPSFNLQNKGLGFFLTAGLSFFSKCNLCF